MSEFKDVESKLNNISNDLMPSDTSKQKAKNLVFAKDYSSSEQESKFNLLNIISMKIFKSKAFWLVGGFAAIALFFAVPLTYFSFTGISDRSYNYAETSMAPVPMPDTDKEFYGRDHMGKNDTSLGSIEPSNMMVVPEIVGSLDGLTEELIAPVPTGYMQPYGDEDIITPQNERAQRRDADINITVEDFNSKHIELNNKVSEVGGYIMDSNTSTYEESQSGYYSFRVPMDEFDGFLNYVRGLGLKINSENVSVVDRQNQLSDTIGEIDEIQVEIDELRKIEKRTPEQDRELSRLENQLERQENQQDRIEKETEFATVQVSMSTEYEYEYDNGWKVEDTWNSVIDSLLQVIQFWVTLILWSIVPILFCMPILVVVLVAVVIIKRRKTKVVITAEDK